MIVRPRNRTRDPWRIGPLLHRLSYLAIDMGPVLRSVRFCYTNGQDFSKNVKQQRHSAKPFFFASKRFFNFSHHKVRKHTEGRRFQPSITSRPNSMNILNYRVQESAYTKKTSTVFHASLKRAWNIAVSWTPCKIFEYNVDTVNFYIR